MPRPAWVRVPSLALRARSCTAYVTSYSCALAARACLGLAPCLGCIAKLPHHHLGPAWPLLSLTQHVLPAAPSSVPVTATHHHHHFLPRGSCTTATLLSRRYNCRSTCTAQGPVRSQRLARFEAELVFHLGSSRIFFTLCYVRSITSRPTRIVLRVGCVVRSEAKAVFERCLRVLSEFSPQPIARFQFSS